MRADSLWPNGAVIVFSWHGHTEIHEEKPGSK